MDMHKQTRTLICRVGMEPIIDGHLELPDPASSTRTPMDASKRATSKS
jgi:hypothetical protein